MKILSIDTSSKICAVAVLEDDTLLKEISTDNGLTHSESLMPIIQSIFNELHLTLNDIDLIVSDIGPGSFTGIRIGVATAKAFSDSLNIKSIGVSSLEGLAYNVADDGIICSLIDAKNDNVYVGVFEKCSNKILLKRTFSDETISDILEELKTSFAEKNIIFVGDGAVTYLDIIKQNFPNCKFAKNNDLSGYMLGLAGFSHFKNNENCDILPLYLKKPQAQRLLEAKEQYSIVSFTLQDLDSIGVSLEQDFDDFWNYNVLKQEILNPNSSYFCIKNNENIVGFVGISIVEDIAELNNIVIKKTERKKGFATLLLSKIFTIAKQKSCSKVYLEVACTNEPAIALYKKAGFVQNGCRKKYYNGLTDALLMEKII